VIPFVELYFIMYSKKYFVPEIKYTILKK